ncbi:hypothetical protein JK386_08940 [Nocardioides sp. zg-536]|uniref:Uncharacterized protein n=1 Tax=Nocardioides faecalis TaxID=2803858 RepID=A0A938Y8B5_9ACTN|nr:hypothetical protein [Nocardioides faecalis]MBM9460028.1 hypothetical protein [Nocardioides faecalis]MBS4753104.1 hypothetical protein [Nocardioides faecalis]QVI58752.1 hypothetical protein KG111_17655 [Nocardioides faecalis]
MSDVAAVRYPTPVVVRGLDVAAKGMLVGLLLLALVDPDGSNLRDKAAEARAIGYPLASFTIPLIWLLAWKERASFPWVPDMLVTLTCFTDILGNRMDLYDQIVWFDDFMHFANTGLLAAAVILLTLHHTTPRVRLVERALAVGATGAIAWEVAEYFAFINGHAERAFAYADTLSDLGLGVAGSVFAALAIHSLWRFGQLREVAPQLGR